MTLASGSYLTYTGSTAAVPSSNAARSLLAWIKCTPSCCAAFGHVLKFGPGAARQQTGLTILTGTYAYFSSYVNDCTTTTTVCDGTWHHVAMTYTSTSAIVYVDGVNIKSCTLLALNTPVNPGLYMGWNGAGSEFWVGSVANAR